MGYELLIHLKEPISVRGINLNELDMELESANRDIERIRYELMLLIGSGFKRQKEACPDGGEYTLGDDANEYVQRALELFEEYEILVNKRYHIELAMANKDSLEESY